VKNNKLTIYILGLTTIILLVVPAEPYSLACLCLQVVTVLRTVWRAEHMLSSEARCLIMQVVFLLVASCAPCVHILFVLERSRP
jgi:hypothetical protein